MTKNRKNGDQKITLAQDKIDTIMKIKQTH